MNEISTRELLKQLKLPEIKLIDVRSPEAFNGWRFRNEKCSGHIPGATNLPEKWLKYLDWIEIVRNKKIYPDSNLIVYGYDTESSFRVADKFKRAGYENISVYKNFIDSWCGDDSLPMNKLSRYQHLVSADWLKSLLTTGKAPEFNNNKFVLCHTHYRNRGAYEEGHIPGAVDLDTNLLESSETWNRRSSSELKNALELTGITCDTTVILYGRFSYPDNDDPFPGSSAGQLAAFRCAFIMMYAGVKDVRILNGGLQAWEDAGNKTVTSDSKKQPVKDFGDSIPAKPGYAVDTSQAKEIIRSEDKNLVSVRSWSEYIGEVSGYNYIKKKGRIPGSVFGNCGSDAYHMENYRNPDHTTRGFNEIEKLWAEAGITPDKHNSFYCGTGWRGSEAFYNAWLMGWEDISVYDGGWFEWSNDDSNPFETGTPENAVMTGEGVLIK